MQNVTPEPDTSRKLAAIELAKKSFAENQGMQSAKRPISKVNRLKGWLAMQLETISTKNYHMKNYLKKHNVVSNK